MCKKWHESHLGEHLLCKKQDKCHLSLPRVVNGHAQARHDASWLPSWPSYVWHHAQHSRCRCARSCQFALNLMSSHVAVLKGNVSKKLSSPSENNLLEWAFFNVGCKRFEARTALGKNNITNIEAVPSRQIRCVASYYCTGVFALDFMLAHVAVVFSSSFTRAEPLWHHAIPLPSRRHGCCSP